MPLVQRREANLVSHEPADVGYLKVNPSAEAFGGGMAQAIQGLGQAGYKLAVEVQDRYDETQAKSADLAYADKVRALTAAYGALKGKDAVDGYDRFQADLQAAQDEASGRLRGGARRLFDGVAARRREEALDGALSHSLEQRSDWEDRTSDDRKAASLSDGALGWNDEFKSRQGLETALAEDVDTARRKGLGEEGLKLLQAQTRQKFWRLSVNAAFASDPNAALTLFTQHWQEMDVNDVTALRERFRVAGLMQGSESAASIAVNGGVLSPDTAAALGRTPPPAGKGGPAAIPAAPGKTSAAPGGSQAPGQVQADPSQAPTDPGQPLAGRMDAPAATPSARPAAPAPPTGVTAAPAAPTPLSVRPAAQHTGSASLPSPGPAKPPPPYGPSNPLPAALTRAVEQPKVPGQYIKALPPKIARPKRPLPPFKVEPFDLNKMTLQGAPQLKPKEEHRGELTEALTPDMEARVRQSKGAQTVGVDQAIVIAVKIRREAIAQGINPDTALIMALIESNLDPKAVKGGMVGLFQFKADTWKELGGGDRFDADTNIKRAMAYAKKNLEALRQTLGREPTGDELYILHQQGRAGGLALLGAGNRSAVDVLMGVAKIDRAEAERRIRGNGGRVDMTADEYTQMWKDDFYKKLAELDAPAAPKAAPKPAAPKTAAAPKPTPKPTGAAAPAVKAAPKRGVPPAGARR